MKAVKVTTDNKVTILDCPEGIPLDWLRKEIGCEWIEIVRPLGLPRGYVMIIDEEGKLKPNAMNMVGSFLYQTHKHGDEIMGNFVLVKEDWGDEGLELTGLSDEMARFIKAMCDKFIEEDDE